MKWYRLIVVLVMGSWKVSAANWPAWRGPHGDGVCDEMGLPMHWSTTENLAWAVDLPERGNSTPIVWGDQVFMTQAIEKEGSRMVWCFDRKTGAKLWEAGTTYKEAEATHATNPYCAGSPATDGERVIANFASAGVFCFDLKGREIWRRDLGKLHHICSNGASPVLANGLCYLNVGPSEKVKLVALDIKTGVTVWEREEPRQTVPGNQPDFYGSWSDPLPRVIDGKPQLIMSWPFRVCAMEAMTGKEIWTCRGLNALVYTTPLMSDGIVVSMGGYNGMALGVKVGGQGDVTESHRLWHHEKSPQRIGSGAIHDGHIFILNEPGVAQCFNLKSGEQLWQERLQGPAATGQNWSSLVISENRCYAVNQGGDVFVFKASPKFELLATNSLEETVIGSIAVSDGQLFIRGYKHLYCVGRK